MVTARRDKINNDALGTGRRKSSIARVRIRPGQGKITINRRSLEEYFCNEQEREALLGPLKATGQLSQVDVMIRVHGGGINGQAGACRMGIARALLGLSEDHFTAMRDGGFLTRDARMKERKKYGLRGARRGTQFSKR